MSCKKLKLDLCVRNLGAEVIVDQPTCFSARMRPPLRSTRVPLTSCSNPFQEDRWTFPLPKQVGEPLDVAAVDVRGQYCVNSSHEPRAKTAYVEFILA